jgi:hypothetical protein
VVRRARPNGKLDANHTEIVQALRKLGCPVLDISMVGGGAPDLVVATIRGEWIMLELKTAKGVVSERQKQFHSKWPGIIHIVRSVDEALRAVGLDPGAKPPDKWPEGETAVIRDVEQVKNL